MVSPQGKTTTYRYNAVGNRDSVISPNGVTSGYQYDDLNRLTRVRHYQAGGVLAHYAYTLNAAGIRTQVTEKDSSKVIYGYDSLYRLKSERRTGNHTDTMTYTYDLVGNRLTKLRRGVTTTYAYNNRDQMLSEWDGTDSTLYSYDAAGRMLTKAEVGGTTHYRWRDEDRLDSLYGPGVSVKYQYDADGRRVKDSTGSTVRQYLIDPLLPYGQVIAETDGGNSLVAEHIYGLDRISQRRGGHSKWFLADGQGSVRMLADSVGVVTDSNYYTAFGEDLFHSGSTVNDFRYVGEQLDPNSGFYYNRARWMDPSTGRFESVDPYEGEPENPVSLHRYLYANASPVSFSDPTGRESYIGALSALSVNSILFNVGQVITSAAARSLGQFIVEAGATVALTYATNEILRDVAQFAPVDVTVASIIGLQIMAREFNDFRKSDEYRRQSRKNPNAKHYIGIWGPSLPKGPTANKRLGSVTLSKFVITPYINGGGGRIFQFRYQIGRNATLGAGYFNYRADYLDYRENPPVFFPHYHLQWGNKNLDHVPFFK